jgi:16S rRNA (guanine527-N7)-methyltransferase
MAQKNKINFSSWKAKNPQGPRTRHGSHRWPAKIYSGEEAVNRLQDLFYNHGFGDLSHQKLRQFAQFYELLMSAQKKTNLTRLHSLKEVAIKHFIDCMMAPKLHPITFPLMDLGTGAGFPGIPIKIFSPEGRIILVEGVQRRVAFLKKARDKLGLKHLDIIGRNLDEDFYYPTRSVITRAVEDIGNSLIKVRPFLAPGGEVLFMKGPKVTEELNFLKTNRPEVFAGYKLMSQKFYTLPGTRLARSLIVFKKEDSLHDSRNQLTL